MSYSGSCLSRPGDYATLIVVTGYLKYILLLKLIEVLIITLRQSLLLLRNTGNKLPVPPMPSLARNARLFSKSTKKLQPRRYD